MLTAAYDQILTHKPDWVVEPEDIQKWISGVYDKMIKELGEATKPK